MHLQVRTEHVVNGHCFNIVSALQISPWPSAVGVEGEDFKFTHRTSPYDKGTALISYFDISNAGSQITRARLLRRLNFLRWGPIFVGPRFGT
jgi:hypothetical protein